MSKGRHEEKEITPNRPSTPNAIFQGTANRHGPCYYYPTDASQLAKGVRSMRLTEASQQYWWA
ncbi:MAG: hypothetical protein M1415_06365 [Firmicutes bacterium]|nr:hypothetical protein [Bacillota bacterium]